MKLGVGKAGKAVGCESVRQTGMGTGRGGLKWGRACVTFWQVKRKKYGMRNPPSNARQSAGNVSKAHIRVKPAWKRNLVAFGIALVAMGAVAFIVYDRGFKAKPPPATAGNHVDFEMLELKDRRRKLEALNSGFGVQAAHITLTEAQRERAQFELAEMMRLPRTPQLEAANSAWQDAESTTSIWVGIWKKTCCKSKAAKDGWIPKDGSEGCCDK